MKAFLSCSLSLAGPTLIFFVGLAGTAMAFDPICWLFGCGHGAGHGFHAPEIDPNMATSALALLAGGGLLFIERFRRSAKR